MRPVSLDLRNRDSGLTRTATAPAQAAGASFLMHAAGITALLVTPLLGSTMLPEPAGKSMKPLVTPVRVVLPPSPPAPAPRLRDAARPANARNLTTPANIPVAIPKAITPDVLDDLSGLAPQGPGATGPGDDIAVCAIASLCGTSGLPPAPAAPREIPHVGGFIKEPRLAQSRAPQYPPTAQAAGVSGKVVIEAHVGADGRVRECHVVESHRLFDDAALESVRSRRYEPLLLNGVPSDFLVTITIVFNIKR